MTAAVCEGCGCEVLDRLAPVGFCSRRCWSTARQERDARLAERRQRARDARDYSNRKKKAS